ncbi:hypothetical protein S7335_5455 [Synechococcus sp. PCC 7335]|nr:hypothetical protein S7335_5455 [Synechococcus sp. PCC 7335]
MRPDRDLLETSHLEATAKAEPAALHLQSVSQSKAKIEQQDSYSFQE